jgi:hypothetical protein
MKRRFLLVSGLGLLAFASGCSCTLIGCTNGLRIRLRTAATAPYRIEATSGGFPGATYVYDCPNLDNCFVQEAFFSDYMPQSVTIKVITAAGTTTTTVQPRYEDFEPNGKHCGPTCRVATVEASFPGT